MRHISLLLSLTLGLASLAIADPILQPPDLNFGDQYRLAFVTSRRTTAESSDIETYNKFVQDSAGAAPIVGDWGLIWKAIAQTESITARENTNTTPSDPSVPIYLLDGGRLVDSYDDLWGGVRRNSARNFFNVTEFGEIQEGSTTGLQVWTGTGEDGVNSELFVLENAGPLGASELSSVGFSDTGPDAWFSSSGGSTFVQLPLYGISETITAVPEPRSNVLLGLALILFRHFFHAKFINRRLT